MGSKSCNTMKLRTPVLFNMIDTREDQDNTTTGQTCIMEDSNKCTEVCKEVIKEVTKEVCHNNKECNNHHHQCQLNHQCQVSHQCQECHRCQLNHKLTQPR